VQIASDDPRTDDIRALLQGHLDWAAQHSPPQDVHALDVDGLVSPSILFVSCRAGSSLLGVGALKDLGDGHGELKSMHTAAAFRGRGVARGLLAYLVAVARNRGLSRLSLETGSMDAFAPARSLYTSAGFEPCGPFGSYAPSAYSSLFTRTL